MLYASGLYYKGQKSDLDNMSSGPDDPEQKHRFTSGPTLEEDIEKFRELQRFVQNESIPLAIRQQAQPKSRQLTSAILQRVRDHYNELSALHNPSQELEMIKRARRVVDGAEP